MTKSARLLAVLALAASSAGAQGNRAAPIMIRNATVLTVTKGTLTGHRPPAAERRIAAIGAGLAAPSGATIIDATGKYVMPGIIDPHSHLMSRRDQRGLALGHVDGAHRRRPESDLGRDLPRARRRRDDDQHPARLGQHDRRAERDGEAQVWAVGERDAVPRRDARDQVRARRERDAQELEHRHRAGSAAGARALSDVTHGPGRRCCATRSRALATTRPTGRSTAPAAVASGGSRPATRPRARAAGRGARGQAPRARAFVSRRRDADAPRPRRRVRLQDQDAAARARGIQDRRRDREARRGSLVVRRQLVVQDRGVRRDSVQRRHPDAPRRCRRRSTPTRTSGSAG